MSEQSSPGTGEPHPAAAPPGSPGDRRTWLLILGSLGVVFGDIGTDPLFALRACFTGSLAPAVSPENVLGAVSLVFWALTLVVSVKYLLIVFRADNRGEGGILALLALNRRALAGARRRRLAGAALWVGLFGAGMLFADAVVTPAISVLSAVEGIKTSRPWLDAAVGPLCVAILAGLFLLQRRGTGRVGGIFGPVMALWFVTIGAIGIPAIAERPDVLRALHPGVAASFLVRNGLGGFVALGGVVLAVAGVEAFYADMGHFGKGPIRTAWYGLVKPSLLLNYFGQGALLLREGPAGLGHPFYGLAPDWLLPPLIVLATAATVIASQSLISGTFSLSEHAIELGYLPRMRIVHTSPVVRGQIYVPLVNWLLMAGSVGLVLLYRDSGRLAGMYAISVIGTLVTVSLHFFITAWKELGWGLRLATAVLALFLAGDLAFAAAGVDALAHGGWVPALTALLAAVLMDLWRRGMTALRARHAARALPLQALLERVRAERVPRVAGSAVFLTEHVGIAPATLVYLLELKRSLQQTALVLCIVREGVPTVPPAEALAVTDLGDGFFQAILRTGYLAPPDVRGAVVACARRGVPVDEAACQYWIRRDAIVATPSQRGTGFGLRLFALAFNRMRPLALDIDLPPERTVKIGVETGLSPDGADRIRRY